MLEGPANPPVYNSAFLNIIAHQPPLTRYFCIASCAVVLTIFNLVAPGFDFDDLAILFGATGLASAGMMLASRRASWFGPAAPPYRIHHSFSSGSHRASFAAGLAPIAIEGAESTAVVLTVAPEGLTRASADEANPAADAAAAATAAASGAAASLKAVVQSLVTGAPGSQSSAANHAIYDAGAAGRPHAPFPLPVFAVLGATACACALTLTAGAAAARVRSIAVIAPMLIMGALVAVSACVAHFCAAARPEFRTDTERAHSSAAGALEPEVASASASAPAPAPAPVSVASAAEKAGALSGDDVWLEGVLVLAPFAGFAATLVTESLAWFALCNAVTVSVGVAVATERRA